jgi:hypothetical protein
LIKVFHNTFRKLRELVLIFYVSPLQANVDHTQSIENNGLVKNNYAISYIRMSHHESEIMTFEFFEGFVMMYEMNN